MKMYSLAWILTVYSFFACAELSVADTLREDPGGDPRKAYEPGSISITPTIKNVKYTSEKTLQDKQPQITEQFRFQVPVGRYDLEIPVSLRLFDYEARAWVDTSVDKRQSKYCYYRNECRMFGCSRRWGCETQVTLEKPLIGFDLLKSGGCNGDDFTPQPFSQGRWGAPEKDGEETDRCYLITISAGGQSAAQMIPENCSQKRVPVLDVEEQQQAAEPFQSRHSRSTSSHSITQFTKRKMGGLRKFVCRVAYTHMGGSVNLSSGFPSANVKVFYKNNDSATWGSHLLDLSWNNYNGADNGFVSWVSKEHLQEQGVRWNKCYKCEVRINGVVERSCLGNCTCN